VDQRSPVRSAACSGGHSGQIRWGWKRWTTWGNLGLLLAAVVLPFGWLLPAAKLARVRVSARRSRNF